MIPGLIALFGPGYEAQMLSPDAPPVAYHPSYDPQPLPVLPELTLAPFGKWQNMY